MLLRFVQDENAYEPIVSSFWDIVILLSFVSAKAYSSIDVTPDGILIVVIAVFWNECGAISFMLDDSVTEESFVQFRNAHCSIDVTESGIVILSRFIQEWNALFPIVVRF